MKARKRLTSWDEYDGKTLDDDNEVYREDQNNFPYRYESKKKF